METVISLYFALTYLLSWECLRCLVKFNIMEWASKDQPLNINQTQQRGRTGYTKVFVFSSQVSVCFIWKEDGRWRNGPQRQFFICSFCLLLEWREIWKRGQKRVMDQMCAEYKKNWGRRKQERSGASKMLMVMWLKDNWGLTILIYFIWQDFLFCSAAKT